jgi:aspartate-semialdehyde dehydrogenase
MEHRVAILGATGLVGRTLLRILEERGFPAAEVVPLASARSAGSTLPFRGRELPVREAVPEAFEGIDLVLSSAGAAVSRRLLPEAAARGAVSVDNTSAYRLDDDVPLVVPEVNRHRIADYRARRIIANPNCSTIQLVVALKPLHDKAKIKRVVVATYQSVSGAGKEAMDELFAQSRAIFSAETPEAEKFSKRIAFNVIPHIDVFMEDGSTREEWKMAAETKKILDPKIELVATCVRVPVFIGHSEAVHVEFEKPLSADDARQILRNAKGVLVVDKREPGGYVTPFECVGEDATFVSRIREDKTVKNGLAFWCVSDNLRKGAALNAIQIAESLVNRKLLSPKKKAA